MRFSTRESQPGLLLHELENGGKLKVLMRDTVVYGTCRKSFRPLRRKKAFKDVDFGAKTGTINDKKDQFKYDWFTGYVLPQNGKRQ